MSFMIHQMSVEFLELFRLQATWRILHHYLILRKYFLATLNKTACQWRSKGFRRPRSNQKFAHRELDKALKKIALFCMGFFNHF